MKIGPARAVQVLVVLLAGIAVYAGISHGAQIMHAVESWFKPENNGGAKPAPQADKPVVLVPLGEQIARCQKKPSGYQACMYAAGYAINPDWIAAHNKDAPVAGTNAFSTAIEIIGDQYRSGASPVYKVPYWVPLAAVRPPR